MVAAVSQGCSAGSGAPGFVGAEGLPAAVSCLKLLFVSEQNLKVRSLKESKEPTAKNSLEGQCAVGRFQQDAGHMIILTVSLSVKQLCCTNRWTE